jgi:hypothetical protein
VAIVATLSEQKAAGGLSFVARSSDINATVIDDTVVQKNCSLHIRGNLLASLTIEPGAKVVVEGSVEGKIVNKGGRLLVNNKAHASCITTVGPAEDEARGILKIDLTAVVSNWERLTKFSTVECAAGLEGNAYGCGIEPIAGALARNGCKNFFCFRHSGSQAGSRRRTKRDDLCAWGAVFRTARRLCRRQRVSRHLQSYRNG